ncbi:MAG: glutathione S-transferase N-terminal domain-containing protein [Legionellaceae bacterium]|nr:glutathione S-transferase N-terminal domain-containing protein [Legionellaceae bacterium]
MAIITKRTIMSLHSDQDDMYSHQVRIVLAEKGVNVEIIPAKADEPTSNLLSVNPYATLPTLIDRELVLYDSKIIIEYLDERFPHPPLLPVYPVARAETRKMMHRIENDWYSLVHKIIVDPTDEDAKKAMLDSLINIEPVFADKPYFLSEEFSLLDCSLAPLLWRLPALGVIIPEESVGLHAYMERLFARASFQESLTSAERQLRAA